MYRRFLRWWRFGRQKQASTGPKVSLLNSCAFRLLYIKYCLTSLFFNAHLSQSYAADVCLEPVFWIVDNYAHALGPAFIVAVFLLTSVVCFICYYVGLPWWWATSPSVTVFLVILGNWLLLNVAFHYFMATFTAPGQPPEELISNAVSICKKCIAPKPPRTHHCSVCNKCILKYDHHCPWLSNCVGYRNHRYFFLYMAYTTLGVIFICVFGIKIGYEGLWKYADEEAWTEGENEHLVGHSVRFNLTGHAVPVAEMNDYEMDGIFPRVHALPEAAAPMYSALEHRMITFMAITCVAVLLSLGTLTVMHAKQIHRGETSVESHINKSETGRLAKLNKKYINPYDFGPQENWRQFLGLKHGRTFLRHVLLPSAHRPEGDGIHFKTIFDRHEWA